MMKRYLFLLLCLCAANMAQAAEKYILLEDVKSAKGGYDFYVSNRDVIPHVLSIQFNELTNLKVDSDKPLQFNVPPQVKKKLIMHLSVLSPYKAYGFSYRSRDFAGQANAKHDDTYHYTFPYAHATKHQIVQGYLGSITHQKQYALDFDMPIGTAVLASRAGIVSATEATFDVAGTDVSFKAYANYVKVYHEDGSFASYVHLRKDGVVVQRGQHVEVGQLLGYSGNTGQSSGPHLHFAIHLPVMGAESQTHPIVFRGQHAQAIQPKEHMFYYAWHAGQPAFTSHLGSDIRQSDYTHYRQDIALNGTVRMREEKVDSTTLVFIRNGMATAMQVNVSLRLNHMRCSRDANDLNFQVPAHTEVFAYLLRPEFSTAYSYQTRYQFSKAK